MKAFQFRFRTLGKVRKLQTDLQAKIVSEIELKIAKAENEIQDLYNKEADEVRRLQDLSFQANFADQLSFLSKHFRDEIHREISRKQKEILDLRIRLDEERKILIQKEQKKKIIEKLEDKERAAYADAYNREETKELDEVGTASWSRHRVSPNE